VRWGLRLEEFDFELKHLPGKQNTFADFLSRYQLDEKTHPDTRSTNKLEIMPIQEVQFEKAHDDALLNTLEKLQEEFRQNQMIDKDLNSLRLALKEGEDRDNYFIYSKTDLLYVRTDTTPLLVVPEIMKLKKLEMMHDSPLASHFGGEKTLHRIKTRFHCKGMYRDIRTYCRACALCKTIKTPPPRRAGLLQPITAKLPFEKVHIDILGPLQRSKRGKK